MRSLTILAVLGCVLSPAALAQRPIVGIKVSGNVRLPAAAVIAASGLHVGQTVSRADLDAAAQKTLDTGFFSGVNYRYDLKTSDGATGYALTLQISEEPAPTPVVLDIPGQDTDELWQQLKSADGLVDRRIPGNERASVYFVHVTEAVLQKLNHPEEIIMKPEGNLASGNVLLICRPAHLPKVAAMRFQGNAAITSAALEAALSKVAMGEDYTERDFRRKLELNLRPLYEELGRLTVAFPKVNMARGADDTVAVTAEINEGPVWQLGTVSLNGDALPEADLREAAQFGVGAPANWKRLLLSIHDLEKVLRRDGYIRVSSNAVRAFRDTGQVVDVTVEVRKGPQFRFGELHILGLEAETQDRVAELWKLPAGAPMDELYINEFFRAVLPSLRGKIKSNQSEMHVRNGSNVVDVTITFH